MLPDVKEAYEQELVLARQARRKRSLDDAIAHIERAHILGQRYLFPHFYTHALLLAIAVERADIRETVGQVVRLIAVVPGYLSGWVPKGNTGSANVSALRPMTPPEDLAPLLAGHNVARDVAARMVLWGLAASFYYLVVMSSGLEVFRGR